MKKNLLLILIVLISILLGAYGFYLEGYDYKPNPEEPIGGREVALAIVRLREGDFPRNVRRAEWAWSADLGLIYSFGNDLLGKAGFDAALDGTGADGNDSGTVLPGSDVQDVNDAREDGMLISGQEDGAQSPLGSAEDENTHPDAGDRRLSVEDVEFVTVGEEYFDDAVFIGDSRMVGIYDFGKISNATFLAKESMSVYGMMNSRVSTASGVPSVRRGLESRHFGKVYIMVGLNEMGTGTIEGYIEKYRECLGEIRQIQPDAIIYVQAIMHVTAQFGRETPYFSNRYINERNEALKKLTNGVDIIYLDVNPVYDDARGNLNAELTGDGVHLYANNYGPWKEFLLSHAVVTEDMPSESETDQAEDETIK